MIILIFTVPMLGSYWLELFASVLIFFGKVEKRSRFALRMVFAVVISLAVLAAFMFAAVPLMGFPYERPAMAVYYIVARLTIAVTIYACAVLCYHTDVRTTMFLFLGAYALHGCAYAVNGLFTFLAPNDVVMWTVWACCDVIIMLAFRMISSKYLDSMIDAPGLRSWYMILLFFFLAVSAVCAEGIGQVFRYDSTVLFVMLDIMQLICSLVILFVQFFIVKYLEQAKENAVLSFMRKAETQQYRMSKDAIDMINIKCHDIKHQLRLFADKCESIGDDYLKKLDESISVYGANIRTGNADLDVILTEKSFLCARQGIELTVIADGAALDLMSASDIYSLFGNALDNAIEHVSALDKEHRFIKLSVAARGNFVSVVFRNYYAGKELVTQDGLPLSTKPRDGYHGYGMKSMRNIVEHYGGAFGIEQNNDEFIVKILFPLQPQSGEKL